MLCGIFFMACFGVHIEPGFQAMALGIIFYTGCSGIVLIPIGIGLLVCKTSPSNRNPVDLPPVIMPPSPEDHKDATD
jgi:hypothetical protein